MSRLSDFFSKKIFGSKENETKPEIEKPVESVETIVEEVVIEEPIEEEEVIAEETIVEKEVEEINIVSDDIQYTTIDGNPVVLYKSEDFGASIVLNSNGRIVFDGKINEIGHAAFCHNDKIKSIVIPSSVKRISASAFQNCVNLSEITIPDSVEIIEKNAFKNIAQKGVLKIKDTSILINSGSIEAFNNWDIKN